MIDELKALINKEIQASTPAAQPKTIILKVEKEKIIITLPKQSK